MAAGQPVGTDVTVTNTGKVQGDEAVQVYLKFSAMKGAPPSLSVDCNAFIWNQVRARRFISI